MSSCRGRSAQALWSFQMARVFTVAAFGIPWPSRWLRWPDFWLPLSVQEARSALEEAHRRAAAGQRVEVACGGGIGRTGTALACIAQLGGVSPKDAAAWVRTHYDSRAIETPWQRRYVRRFSL
jgi:protein-tyrosine phosphatase